MERKLFPFPQHPRPQAQQTLNFSRYGIFYGEKSVRPLVSGQIQTQVLLQVPRPLQSKEGAPAQPADRGSSGVPGAGGPTVLLFFPLRVSATNLGQLNTFPLIAASSTPPRPSARAPPAGRGRYRTCRENEFSKPGRGNSLVEKAICLKNK